MNNKKEIKKLRKESFFIEGLISIIIPCYNQAKYLREAVDSIKKQSYGNWECLIIDDGSRDNTERVSHELSKEDSRIRFFKQKNRGVSSARNLGLKQSRGEFIQFLDADDKLESGKFRISISLLNENPTLAGVVSDARYFTDAKPNDLKFNIFDNNEWMRFLWEDKRDLLEKCLMRNLTPVNCPIFRASLYHKVGFFDESMQACEDWDFWSRCFSISNSFKFLQVDQTRALIRTHDESTSQSRQKMYEGEYDLILKTSRLFDNSHPLYKSCYDIAISRLKNNIVKWHINQLIRLIVFFPSKSTLASFSEILSLRYKVFRKLLHGRKTDAELRLYYTNKHAYQFYKRTFNSIFQISSDLLVSTDYILNRIVDYLLSIKYTKSQLRPFPGFRPDIYAKLKKIDLAESIFDYLGCGLPLGPWCPNLLKTNPPKEYQRCSLKTALHIHLHYPDDLDDILTRISCSKNSPDLFFSVTSDEVLKLVEKKTQKITRYKIKYRKFPNTGRNIAPLFTGYSKELASYDLIGHVHGKKSPHLDDRDFLNSWKSFLYENVLGGAKPMVDFILSEFEEHPSTGMIFPDDPITYGWGHNYEVATQFLQRLGISNPDDSDTHIVFPVGMMFWARRQTLQPFFDLNFSWSDYPKEPISTDGTILHAIERVIPIVNAARGFDSVVTAERFFDRTLPPSRHF